MSELTQNLKKLKIDKGIRRQLYSFYPIPNGCPKCGSKDIIGVPCNSQLGGHENKNLTVCPQCNAGLNLVICDQKNSKLVPTDLSYFCPSGNVMDAQLQDGIVIAMPILSPGGDV